MDLFPIRLSSHHLFTRFLRANQCLLYPLQSGNIIHGHVTVLPTIPRIDYL